MSQCNSRVTVILLTCYALSFPAITSKLSHFLTVVLYYEKNEMKTNQLHLHFLSLALLAGRPDEDGCETTRTVG